MDKREIFERMPVPKALAALAVPTIISQLITMIYNIADSIFIGMRGDTSLSAGSFVAFNLLFMMNCLPNLFGVGGGSLISRLLGQKKDKDAQNVSSFSFYCTLIAAVVYAITVFVFMDPLLNLIGADADSLPYARQYAFWVVVIGAIPTTLSMTMSQLLRSEGYASKASIGLGMGGILNIILDPIFMFLIFEPGNEVRGAAIATMISNVITLIYFLIIHYNIRKKTVISLDLRNFCVPKEHAKEIFAIGIPAALGSFLACLSSIIVNKLSSVYGPSAVTAIGAAKKIDMLPMNVGFGLSQGMMPLVAYNYASGDYKRMRTFARTSRNAGMIFAGFCIVLFQIFAPQLVWLINSEAKAVAMGTDFLRIFCLAVPLMIFNIQISFTFQAMGMGRQSLILSSLRQGVVNIPLLFVMNHFFPLYGIVWTQLLSDALTAVVSYAVYRRSLGKLMNNPENVSE